MVVLFLSDFQTFLYEKISPFSSEQERKGCPSTEVLAGTSEGLGAGTLLLPRDQGPAQIAPLPGSFPRSALLGNYPRLSISRAQLCGRHGLPCVAEWSDGGGERVGGRVGMMALLYFTLVVPLLPSGSPCAHRTMGALDTIAVRQNRRGTFSHCTCLVRTSDLMGCKGWL